MMPVEDLIVEVQALPREDMLRLAAVIDAEIFFQDAEGLEDV